MRNRHLIRFAIVALTILPLSSQAVWQWMRGAAVADFKDSDWVLLKQAAYTALNESDDGKQINWTNPDTGNRGSIVALNTFTHDGFKCRRAAMRNLSANGREGKAAYSLCRQPDGDWIFVAESALQAAAAEEEQ